MEKKMDNDMETWVLVGLTNLGSTIRDSFFWVGFSSCISFVVLLTSSYIYTLHPVP